MSKTLPTRSFENIFCSVPSVDPGIWGVQGRTTEDDDSHLNRYNFVDQHLEDLPEPATDVVGQPGSEITTHFTEESLYDDTQTALSSTIETNSDTTRPESYAYTEANMWIKSVKTPEREGEPIYNKITSGGLSKAPHYMTLNPVTTNADEGYATPSPQSRRRNNKELWTPPHLLSTPSPATAGHCV